MFPYSQLALYFDDVEVLVPIVRAIQLGRSKTWELLVRVGDQLQYEYVELL